MVAKVSYGVLAGSFDPQCELFRKAEEQELNGLSISHELLMPIRATTSGALVGDFDHQLLVREVAAMIAVCPIFENGKYSYCLDDKGQATHVRCHVGLRSGSYAGLHLAEATQIHNKRLYAIRYSRQHFSGFQQLSTRFALQLELFRSAFVCQFMLAKRAAIDSVPLWLLFRAMRLASLPL